MRKIIRLYSVTLFILIFCISSTVLAGKMSSVKPEKAGFSSDRLERIHDLMQQNIDDGNKLTFDKDENGTPRMFIGSVLASGYKLSGMDSPVFHNTVLAFSLLIFLYALIAWPVQKYYRTKPISKSLKRSRTTGWSLSLCTFITLIGFVSTISESVVSGYSFCVKFFLYFAYVIVLLTIAYLLFLWPLLRDKSPGKMVKAYHISLGLAGVGICWYLNYWNLIGV